MGRSSSQRDFFSSMVNAEVDLPDLRRFISDWKAVIKELSVTEANRWNEVMKIYHAAQQAVTNQIAAWQHEARQKLAEVQGYVRERVQAAGVPAEQIDAEVVALAAELQDAQERIEQPHPSFSEARSLNTVLGNAQMNLQQKILEIRARYQQRESSTPQEVHLHWRELVGAAHIGSRDDLEQMLARLRTSIEPELEQQKIIIID